MKAENRRIGLIILAIIIIVGIAMVALKGFNVSLYYREHQTLKYTFDVAFEKNDIEKICNEVFENKEYELRTVEVFNDSIYIMSSSITEKEESALVEKLSALYSNNSEENAENNNESKYEIYTDSNVKIRDLVEPYIIPTIISAVIISICIFIRYRIQKVDSAFIKTCRIILESAIVLVVLMSIIAIIRIPVSTWLFPTLMFLVLAYIIAKLEMETRN